MNDNSFILIDLLVTAFFYVGIPLIVCRFFKNFDKKVVIILLILNAIIFSFFFHFINNNTIYNSTPAFIWTLICYSIIKALYLNQQKNDYSVSSESFSQGSKPVNSFSNTGTAKQDSDSSQAFTESEQKESSSIDFYERESPTPTRIKSKEKKTSRRFCKNCGSEVFPDTFICPGCGKKYNQLKKINFKKILFATLFLVFLVSTLTLSFLYSNSLRATSELENSITKLESQSRSKSYRIDTLLEEIKTKNNTIKQLNTLLYEILE